MRYDIISDTHGWLAPELLRQLQGADMIVHAGDICSAEDYRTLALIAPIRACLGNNDYNPRAYPPQVKRKVRFRSCGLRWQICHYQRDLNLDSCDIAICGHTHRPFVMRDPGPDTLIMNPGSPTYPRSVGASMGRIRVENGHITEARIIKLDIKRGWFW